MKPLIDGDILLHEIGWSAEFEDKETEERVLFDFDRVVDILEDKISVICEDVNAKQEDCVFFFTDSEWLSNKMGRPFKEGFRYNVAKTKPYKGNRKNPKPFHFYNILEYLKATKNHVISHDGLEADDMLSINQYSSEPESTIICSRDKDLRICPGWHYSWECGKQRSKGPRLTDEQGWLEDDGTGYGLTFFWYQMLVGDAADNIPGLPKWGAKKAQKLICDSDYGNLPEKIKDCYKESNMSKEYFLEQANLLWMIREIKDNKPVRFKL